MTSKVATAIALIVGALAIIGGTVFASYKIGLMVFVAAGGSGPLAIAVAIVAFIVALKIISVIIAIVLQLLGLAFFL